MTTRHTPQELAKMTKMHLAQMHVRNGGLMGLQTYLQWSKDELISTILTDESYMGLDLDSDKQYGEFSHGIQEIMEP